MNRSLSSFRICTVQVEGIHSLLKSAKRRPLWEHQASTAQVNFQRESITRILPHRDPFLFVDAIHAIDLEQGTLGGHRSIHHSDPVFVGHFPGAPVYPGVLQIETMGQLGLCLTHFCERATCEIPEDATPVSARALKIHHALFLSEVRPGDELTILATLLHHDGYTAICAGQLLRGEIICSLAVMETYFVDG
jgi:3-hydroxyacyl-[acyl-carrier-protein] dehydratase